jgi:N-acyl-D-amino-acid deacylase
VSEWGTSLFDSVVRGAVVLDGSGLPRRRADIAIVDGVVAAVGRIDERGREEIDADGLIAMPGIVDAHTHYDPILTFDPWATSSCFHGVTTVVTANCGFSIAPCAPADRVLTAEFMAAVEGFSAEVLHAGLPWSWDTFPSYLDSLEGRLGVNAATYLAHSALRRFVMGDRASDVVATEDEIVAMERLVREARRAGACGFSTERMGAEPDHLGRPTPSCVADEEEVRRLVDASGVTPRGSLAFLPESAGPGLSDADGARLRSYALAAGLPVVIQAIGWRPGMDEQWSSDQAFLEEANAQGASVFGLYRNHPMYRPFDFVRGTSLVKGLPRWRDMQTISAAERLALVRSEEGRASLRWGFDHPFTDPNEGATTPPPPMVSVFVEWSSQPATVGRSVADIAAARGVHPSDVLCDLLDADELATKFAWRSENEEWLEKAAETLRHPNILIGTGDGGAHADRDDGSEWSTYFLSRWVRDRGLFSLEEGVRRITSVPAQVCGLSGRGMLAPGFAADVVLFDLDALRLTEKALVRDLPAGGERWRASVAGIERVLVNGRTIVDSNELTGEMPGHVLR